LTIPRWKAVLTICLGERVTDGQKEARKLAGAFLNGIGIACVTGSAITPAAAYVIGTTKLTDPDWIEIGAFVSFMWVVAVVLHIFGQQVVRGIK
jgi:hypothetical protein